MSYLGFLTTRLSCRHSSSLFLKWLRTSVKCSCSTRRGGARCVRSFAKQTGRRSFSKATRTAVRNDSRSFCWTCVGGTFPGSVYMTEQSHTRGSTTIVGGLFGESGLREERSILCFVATSVLGALLRRTMRLRREHGINCSKWVLLHVDGGKLPNR